LHVDEKALIRGCSFCMIYFFYMTGTIKEHEHKRPHGFFHPSAALLQCKAGFYTDEERRKYHTKAYVSIDTDPAGM